MFAPENRLKKPGPASRSPEYHYDLGTSGTTAPIEFILTQEAVLRQLLGHGRIDVEG